MAHGLSDEWVRRYEGLDLDRVIALAERDRRPYRVIPPGGAITADYHERRLNMELDADGNIVRLWRG